MKNKKNKNKIDNLGGKRRKETSRNINFFYQNSDIFSINTVVAVNIVVVIVVLHEK